MLQYKRFDHTGHSHPFCTYRTVRGMTPLALQVIWQMVNSDWILPLISFLPPQASLHVSHLGQYCPPRPTWVEKQTLADLHTSQCPAAPCGFGHRPGSKKWNPWTWFTFIPPDKWPQTALALSLAQLSTEVKQRRKVHPCVCFLKQSHFLSLSAMLRPSWFLCISTWSFLPTHTPVWVGSVCVCVCLGTYVDVSVCSRRHQEPVCQRGVALSVYLSSPERSHSATPVAVRALCPPRRAALLPCLPPLSSSSPPPSPSSSPPPHSCLLSCVHWPSAHSSEHVLFISHGPSSNHTRTLTLKMRMNTACVPTHLNRHALEMKSRTHTHTLCPMYV